MVIYCIDNLKNKKYYIGSTTNFNSRRKQHFYLLSKGLHPNPHLQGAYNKYGKEAFIITPIEKCSIETLKEREQFWIDNTKCLDNNFGYNICKEVGTRSGIKHSQESRDKISKSQKGVSKANKEERIKQLRASWEEYSKKFGNPRKGIPNPEHSDKVSKAVLQFDLEGNFIREYKNSLEAAKFLGGNSNHNLRKAIYGKRNSFKGFIWKYK